VTHCTICQAQLPPSRRTYCGAACARAGVRLWKRELRARTRALWVAGLSADPPSMDGWTSIDARRGYFREYMRRRRAASRVRQTVRESSTQHDC